jgi:hypothetical protein
MVTTPVTHGLRRLERGHHRQRRDEAHNEWPHHRTEEASDHRHQPGQRGDGRQAQQVDGGAGGAADVGAQAGQVVQRVRVSPGRDLDADGRRRAS